MHNRLIRIKLIMPFAVLFILGINAGIMDSIGIPPNIIILDIVVKCIYVIIILGIFHIIRIGYGIYNK